jgi:hypothetical protein
MKDASRLLFNATFLDHKNMRTMTAITQILLKEEDGALQDTDISTERNATPLRF